MVSESTEIYIAAATAIGAVILIFSLFIVFIIITQRRVMALQKKLLKAEILSIEKERERVASDLHDSLGSTLAAMALLNKQVVANGEASKNTQNQLAEYINSTSLQIKQIAKNITPRLYEDTTVEKAMEKLVAEFSIICQQKNIELALNCKADIILPKENILHIYRVAQEVLNNACKHSQAKKITFTCLYAKNALVLAFNDDGVGYNVQENFEGLGLSNIQNRIQLLNGSHYVESKKGKGTEVLIRIPVEVITNK